MRTRLMDPHLSQQDVGLDKKYSTLEVYYWQFSCQCDSSIVKHYCKAFIGKIDLNLSFTYLPTYIPTYPPTYLPTYPPT